MAMPRIFFLFKYITPYAARVQHAKAYSLFVYMRFQNADKRQIAVSFRIIKPITNNEFIRYVKPVVICFDLGAP